MGAGHTRREWAVFAAGPCGGLVAWGGAGVGVRIPGAGLGRRVLIE